MRESEHNKDSQKSKQIQFIIITISFESDDRMKKIMLTGLFHILKLLIA